MVAYVSTSRDGSREGGVGVSSNLDPFGQTEKRVGRGCENWTFFMGVINLWLLATQKSQRMQEWLKDPRMQQKVVKSFRKPSELIKILLRG